jgi:hypothetical protein
MSEQLMQNPLEPQPANDQDTILVVTSDTGTRSSIARKLKIDEFSVNVNLFLEQMNSVLEKTPEKLGKFQFVEFEVHAEVTAKGSLAILGAGGEAGAAGGIRFVFRRSLEAQADAP